MGAFSFNLSRNNDVSLQMLSQPHAADCDVTESRYHFWLLNHGKLLHTEVAVDALMLCVPRQVEKNTAHFTHRLITHEKLQNPTKRILLQAVDAYNP